jgi:thermitase
MIRGLIIATAFWVGVANAAAKPKDNATDLLVKFTNASAIREFTSSALLEGNKIEDLGGGNWVRVDFKSHELRDSNLQSLVGNPNVLYVQPNFKIRLPEDYKLKDKNLREAIRRDFAGANNLFGHPYPDNPAIPSKGPASAGPDPLTGSQWGMLDIGVITGWKSARGDGVVVAVIDTGVDYTHEDLIDNLWRNPGETGVDAQGRDKSTNGVDDDNNGFIDDVIGWDFASNDNKPYDFAVNPIDLLQGGNPGHGTHCAGNVAAVADNNTGIAGVAPGAKIMALRFLDDQGHGDSAGAIKSINYAVKMGAKVLSNSWGSEGEDPNEGSVNQALRESITNAMNAGSLFVAAAGNGHQGVGYDNDTDAKPGYPASYSIANIVSVAALDKNDQLGAFSNWGAKTVHIGAPGVVVFSTTVGSHYSDVVLDLPQYGIKATWDGTSMATPHVAGAAALYWSKHPNATWQDVKAALLKSAKPVSALSGKCVSNGKLSVESLMMQ